MSQPIIRIRTNLYAKRLASLSMAALLATLMVVSTAFAQSAMGADQAAPPKLPGERALPGESGGPYTRSAGALQLDDVQFQHQR